MWLYVPVDEATPKLLWVFDPEVLPNWKVECCVLDANPSPWAKTGGKKFDDWVASGTEAPTPGTVPGIPVVLPGLPIGWKGYVFEYNGPLGLLGLDLDSAAAWAKVEGEAAEIDIIWAIKHNSLPIYVKLYITDYNFISWFLSEFNFLKFFRENLKIKDYPKISE